MFPNDGSICKVIALAECVRILLYAYVLVRFFMGCKFKLSFHFSRNIEKLRDLMYLKILIYCNTVRNLFNKDNFGKDYESDKIMSIIGWLLS